MTKHPDELQPGDEVRHYRVVRRLGTGGNATVYQVEHEGRPYTLKLAVRPACAEDLARTDERAVREAVSLGHFRHPNLPRMLEAGRWPDVEKGYFFLVTDYLPGSTFNQWRWSQQPSLRRLVGVLAEVARVLAELHEQGVFHRDLKPDNLLILEEDERPVLIDFGSAYVPGAYPLTELLPPTTVHNLPPECATLLLMPEGEAPTKPLPANAAMDLYAFGCLLHEALTDCHAFNPRLPPDMLLLAIGLVTPKTPRELDPRVPERLSELTMRLLAKEPEQRPSSARAVHEELLRLLEQEGDTEAWTEPYTFDKREEASLREEPRPDEPPAAPRDERALEAPDVNGTGVSAPIEGEGNETHASARWVGNRGRMLALVGVGLVAGMGIGCGLIRAACARAEELACCGVDSTALDEPAPTEKGRTPLPSSSSATRSPSTPSRLFGRVCRLLGACSAATQLAACASAPVRPNVESFLQQCPPEARETATRFGLEDSETEVTLETVTTACPDDVCSASNVKTGPMGAWLWVDDEDLYWVTGEARVFPDRIYVQFDRIYLDAKYPTRGSVPSPICATIVDYYDYQYGVVPFTVRPGGGVVLDPARVDRSPDAAIITFPRVNARVQFPEADPRNRF